MGYDSKEKISVKSAPHALFPFFALTPDTSIISAVSSSERSDFYENSTNQRRMCLKTHEKISIILNIA